MQYINLNETPEAIFDMKEGDLAYIDNQRMVLEFTFDGKVYLSASSVVTLDPGYDWVHVRDVEWTAVHTRRTLVNMIRNKTYYID